MVYSAKVKITSKRSHATLNRTYANAPTGTKHVMENRHAHNTHDIVYAVE